MVHVYSGSYCHSSWSLPMTGSSSTITQICIFTPEFFRDGLYYLVENSWARFVVPQSLHVSVRVRNLKLLAYLKFATCRNIHKINKVRPHLL